MSARQISADESVHRQDFLLRQEAEWVQVDGAGPGSVVAVSWHWQRLTVLGLEEGVGQSDGIHTRHPGVSVKLRVDVEEDGHVDLLVRIQALLLEAETLQTHRVTR